MYRLGQWAEDKARPLLVAFGNGEMKDEIMANLRNLKQPIEKFKGISISHDLPPPKREEIKRMVEEAKQEHVSSNGDNSAENYKFIVVGRGPRRKVIRIKRKKCVRVAFIAYRCHKQTDDGRVVYNTCIPTTCCGKIF